MNIPISVVVLTKNEEVDIVDCIKSVSFSDDIHIFDSFSDDATIQMSEELGAITHQRAFDGYASQRNASLREVEYKHEWLLVLDADERVTPELTKELEELFQNGIDEATSAFMIRRKDYFMGTWLKHVQATPYYSRLIRHKDATYEREINEVVEVSGETEQLTTWFDHFPFSKGMSFWLERHNRYSTGEAEVILNNRSTDFSLIKVFTEKDLGKKRVYQKELYYRLPFRGIIMFCVMYILKRGFLDGKAGFNYSILRAIYEMMIEVKVSEAKHK